MLVKQVMDRTAAVCVPFDTAKSAASIMKRNDIAFIPVVENEPTHTYMGAVTDRSLCLNVIANGLNPDRTQLSEYLAYSTVFCRPDDPIEKALQIMRRKRLSALAVLDTGRGVVGVVSLDDLANRSTRAAPAKAPEPSTNRSKEPGYRAANRISQTGLKKARRRP